MVLDASGAIEFLLNTASGSRLAERLADDREAICVPHLIDIEIVQALRRYVLRGGLSSERATLALSHWQDLDVERYPHEPLLEQVWALRANVSAYDAIYVALARMLSTVLVTADGKLARAPGLKARIELIRGTSEQLRP